MVIDSRKVHGPLQLHWSRICELNRTVSVVLLMLLVPATASAQFPDLLELTGQYMPPVELDHPGNLEVQVASYDASFNIPIPLAKKSFLIVGAAYHSDSVSYSEMPPGFEQLRAFHAVDLTLLFVQLLPKDWSLSVRFAPGLAGDFVEVDGGYFRANALAMATKGISDSFVLGGGIITSYGFGSFLPLPAVYLEWKPLEQLTLEAFLPAFVSLRYTFVNRVELGVRLDFSGNEYAVRDERIRSRWPCQAQAADDPKSSQDETQAAPEQCLDHLAYSVGSAGLTVGVRLFHTLWFSAFAGHSFYRRFDQKNADNELIPGGGQDIPNVFVFRVGLNWRIPRS